MRVFVFGEYFESKVKGMGSVWNGKVCEIERKEERKYLSER